MTIRDRNILGKGNWHAGNLGSEFAAGPGGAAELSIRRITESRDRMAVLVAEGQVWALPIFIRLEAELEKAKIQQSALDRARDIALGLARTCG